jgi:hypothetical protein
VGMQDRAAIEAELNRLGRECWELVSFDGEIAVLKRRITDLADPPAAQAAVPS